MTIALKNQPTTINVWASLTTPHRSITDIEEHRQSRLLAGLALTLLITTVVADILLFTGQLPGTVKFLLPGQICTLIVYFINRTGRYRLAAPLFVLQNFVLVFVAAVGGDDISWLLFVSLPLILSAIFLSVRVTTLLFVGCILILIVLKIVHPISTTATNPITITGALITFIITSALVLVFVRHRTGLERERQQELQTVNTQLRTSEKALQQINLTLEQRVKDRTVDLERAKEEAERANLVKSAFLASMSHELRTPLNATINFSKFVARGTVGPVNDRQATMLNNVVSSSEHLLNLINDVLDMSKIESGSLTLFVENSVDLAPICQSVVATGQSLLEEKPVVIKTDLAPDLPQITGDKQRILQVLLNIVSNACKFTEAGQIELSAKVQGNDILLTVSDTGPGIPRAEWDLVFEAFKQTETGLRKVNGTGLGMPISKSLVEAHGGKMWLDSTVGQGSTFYVTLPIQSTLKSTVTP